MSKLNYTPIADRVLILPIEDEFGSGVLARPNIDGEVPTKGRIIATGPGRTENGNLVPMQTRVGDVVMYPKHGTQQLELNGVTYRIGRELDLYTIITTENE